MTKILLQDTVDHHRIACEFNRGACSVVLCTIASLKKLIPDAEFVSCIQFTSKFSTLHNLKVVNSETLSSRHFSLGTSLKSWWLFIRCSFWAILRKYFHLEVTILVNHIKLNEYRSSSVIVDISMDQFNDDKGIIKVIDLSREILLGVLLGKPVVIYAQSVGPFKSKLARLIARFALNRVSLITVRENASFRILEEMAINKPPIYVTADPAFLLDPASDKRTREILTDLGLSDAQPLIGIGTPEGTFLGETIQWRGYKNILRVAYRLFEYCLPEILFLWSMRIVKQSTFYKKLQLQHSNTIEVAIAQLADHLVENMGATVLLIPHFVPPIDYIGGEENGLVVANIIHNLVSNKNKVIPVVDEYTIHEIKGIIGQCNLFISMKMHPTIAAISQYVPTIAIGSHHKFFGIMQMLGVEHWVYSRISSELIAKVNEAWRNKEEIAKELKSKHETINKLALLNAQLVKQLLGIAC